MARITQLSEHLTISRVSTPRNISSQPHQYPIIPPYFFSHRYPLSFLTGTIILPRRKRQHKAFKQLLRTDRPGLYLIRRFLLWGRGRGGEKEQGEG